MGTRNYSFCFFISVLLVAFAGVMGCSGESDHGSRKTGPDVKPLLKSDWQHLLAMNSDGARKFDATYHNRFTNVFGGTNGSDVMAFLNTRIHYYVSEFDNLRSQPRLVQSGQSESDLRTLASNYGMALWLEGLRNGILFKAIWDWGEASVTSSRVGIVEVGGALAEFTPEERIAYMIHEARHSDCPGGLTQQDVQVLKTITTEKQLIASFPLKCGFFHSYCTGGYYGGRRTPLCDSMPWSTNMIAGIFLEAVTKRSDLDPTSSVWQRASATRDDLKIRLNNGQKFPSQYWNNAMNGMYGDPDLSSSNHVAP